MKYTILISLAFLILLGCSPNKKIVGLWQIEKVKMGSQEMTPIAKWTKFNADHSQESGNGWVQHTIGNWNYSSGNKQISISNTNGTDDEFGGFKIEKISKNNMVWSREEEGQHLTVNLKRINKLPTAPANKLLGVWKLKDDDQTSLFFRWDHIIVKNNKNKKQYGLYKTHGHKQELEIIYYEEPLRQEIWTYNFSGNGDLILNLKSDKDQSMIFNRTYQLSN